MFMTPGALEVVLRLASLTPSFAGVASTPPMAESTLVRSDVSADMMSAVGRAKMEDRVV